MTEQLNEVETLKMLAESLAGEKSSLEKGLVGIDEKYRKLAEKEKAETAARLKSVSARVEVYSSLISQLTGSAQPVKREQADGRPEDVAVPQPEAAEKPGEPAAEEAQEPRITDTLFPENNGAEAGGGAGPAQGNREAAPAAADDLPEGDLPDDSGDWPAMPEEWN